jgi:hypothetical protein
VVALVVLPWLGLSVAVYLPFKLTRTSINMLQGYVIEPGTQALEKAIVAAASLTTLWLAARRTDAALRHTVGPRGLFDAGGSGWAPPACWV